MDEPADAVDLIAIETSQNDAMIDRLSSIIRRPLQFAVTPHFAAASPRGGEATGRTKMKPAPGTRSCLPSPITDAARAIASRTLSPVALTQAYLDRIAAYDAKIGAFAYVDVEGATATAQERAEELAQGRYRGALHGIPLAVKDVIDVAGMPTRANSHIRPSEHASKDAGCVAKLRAAGAVILGKVLTHEFAYAGPPEDLPFGAARNPWNLVYDTGGSSSGSAAAIIAGFCAGALGTDTGGSIRNPVSYCGGVGLKPTYGRVGRSGIVPLSWSLDHCGPMARTVADCAAILQAIAGADPADPSCVAAPIPDFAGPLGEPVLGIKVGVLREFYDFEGGASDEIRTAIEAASKAFAGLGCEIVQIDLPSNDVFSACGRLIVLSEAYAYHRDDLATRAGSFGRWTRDRLQFGRQITASDYIQALRMRTVLRSYVDEAFDRCDVILTASARSAAPKLELGGPDAHWNASSPTIAFNVTGHPALAMCGGFNSAGLPLGFQLVGRAFAEPTLFQIAHAYEEVTRWMEAALPPLQ